MNLQEIDHLITKYEQGFTSIEEEQELRAFFARDEIPEKYKVYKELFGFYDLAVKQEFPDPDFDNRFFENLGVQAGTKTRKLIPFGRYTWWSIAASIILLAGLYLTLNNRANDKGTYDDPKLAYAETRKVLMMVSGNLNEGMQDFSNIKEFNKGVGQLHNLTSFNEGLKSMEKISTLDKSTNVIKQ